MSGTFALFVCFCVIVWTRFEPPSVMVTWLAPPSSVSVRRIPGSTAGAAVAVQLPL